MNKWFFIKEKKVIKIVIKNQMKFSEWPEVCSATRLPIWKEKKCNLEGRNFKMIEEKREFKLKEKKLYVINGNPSKRQISE